MANFTIFGSGNMGTALDEVLAAGGASIDHINHTDAQAQITGAVVILAVPYPALEEIVERYGEQLANKVVVDITNPLDFTTFDSLVVPSGSSAASELATALPTAQVVKAFNTTFAATLRAKSIGPNPTVVLVAADDADAKDVLIEAIRAGGIEAVDVGPLRRSRELEAIGFLQMTLAANAKTSWAGGFALVR
jgi:predicted dinucleotide-binding enzyme